MLQRHADLGATGAVRLKFHEAVLGDGFPGGISAVDIVEGEQPAVRRDVEPAAAGDYGRATPSSALSSARRLTTLPARRIAYWSVCDCFSPGKNSLRSRSSMARSVQRRWTLPSGATHRSPGSIQPQVLSRLAISTHGWNLPVVMSSVQV